MSSQNIFKKDGNNQDKHFVIVKGSSWITLVGLSIGLMLFLTPLLLRGSWNKNPSLQIGPLIEPSNSSFIISVEKSYEGVEELTPAVFLWGEREKVSNTGLNSTYTKMVYNPVTGRIGVSWVDLFNPGTPAAISSINFLSGNKDEGWSQYLALVSVSDTMTGGYNPTPDDNGTVHIVFEEFNTDNYDLSDQAIEDESNPQTKVAVISNAGNSTCPVTVVDLQGIVHLVWIDTTNNPLGDLYYSYFDSAVGSWSSETIITSGAEIETNSLPAVAVDTNNTIHVVWVDKRAGGDQELYYAYKEEGGSWSTEQQITNVAYAPIKPAIAIDDNNELQIIFRDNGTSTNLYHTSFTIGSNLTSWLSPTVVVSYIAEDGNYDIYSGQFGKSLIAYELDLGSIISIYLIQKDSGAVSWSVPELVSSLTASASAPSIVTDPSGTLYISYAEFGEGTASEVFVIHGLFDSDGDGLSDLDEENIYNTNPNEADSDGDSLSDGEEILTYGTNPLSQDSDSDQMPDNFEVENSLDATDPSDASEDSDGDDLTNLEEFNAGTKPHTADTDGDTLKDGAEVKVHGTNPLDDDTDGDGLSDAYEVNWGLNPLVADDVNTDPDDDGVSTLYESFIGTDPLNSDTDGDGYDDGTEISYGTDPLNDQDFPQIKDQRDLTSLSIAIMIGTIAAFLFLGFAIFIARQFRPRKSAARKDLEREEATLGSLSGVEAPIPSADRETFERIRASTPTEEVEKPSEERVEMKEVSPPEKEPLDIGVLEAKREEINKHVESLLGYQRKLEDLRNNKMSPQAVRRASREVLTEYASESQSLYSEAKAIWNSSILPIIKGFEEPLYSDTLAVEKILDTCKELTDQILEILVLRELQFSEEEEKSTDETSSENSEEQ